MTFRCIRWCENYRHEAGLEKVRTERFCSRLRRLMCGKPTAFRHELFLFDEAIPPSSGKAQPLRENVLTSLERQSLSAHHAAKPPATLGGRFIDKANREA